MDRVCKLNINLTNISIPAIIKKNDSNASVLFPNVINVNVVLDGDRPLGSIQYLSTLVDFSRLQTISVRLPNYFTLDMNPVDNIGILLERAFNVRSFAIRTSCVNDVSIANIKGICSILPRHVRHFQVNTRLFEQMKEILEQVQHISSISFRSPG
ncbi:unnamed protein product [Rotaria sordida]|uniref:Uncharacterized protein n=1 Tax=Rotaria sordida TaxID=392033 RepID=A0A815UAS0_9BILA|nr:unnamed protein product [Rotaria sordida]CAF1513352.1 unnamed protein product [Rotaria sordida]